MLLMKNLNSAHSSRARLIGATAMVFFAAQLGACQEPLRPDPEARRKALEQERLLGRGAPPQQRRKPPGAALGAAEGSGSGGWRKLGRASWHFGHEPSNRPASDIAQIAKDPEAHTGKVVRVTGPVRSCGKMMVVGQGRRRLLAVLPPLGESRSGENRIAGEAELEGTLVTAPESLAASRKNCAEAETAFALIRVNSAVIHVALRGTRAER